MKTFVSFLIPGLLVVALVLLALLLIFAIVTCIAVASGWLLRLVFDLTFFESTLLGTLLMSIALFLLNSLVTTFAPPSMFQRPSMSDLLDDVEEDEEEDEDEYVRIPVTRFYASPGECTWEAWLRYEFANDIYAEFQDARATVHNLNENQVQELAIRLADLALEMIKSKTTRARRFAVTIPAFKRAMTKAGLRTYDDDILRLAVSAVNLNLDHYREAIRDLIATKGWQNPSPYFDE